MNDFTLNGKAVYVAAKIGYVHLYGCILLPNVSMQPSYDTGIQWCSLDESGVEISRFENTKEIA